MTATNPLHTPNVLSGWSGDKNTNIQRRIEGKNTDTCMELSIQETKCTTS